MNPIFEYAAKGQSCEKKEDWDQAIQWYQRALACMPNHYGSDIPIKSLSPHSPAPVVFEARHAARIYAAMGSCLIALGRWEDSVLAGRAAHQLDKTNIRARRCLQTGINALEGLEGGGKGCGGPTDVPNGAPDDLIEDLSIVIVTHCVRNLKKYRSLAPPSTRLLETTYGSMVDVFGEAITGCPKFLCYDRNPAGTAMDAEYGQALESFSRQYGFDLHVYDRIGLFAVLSAILHHVVTPYILFAEHDWLFRCNPVRLDTIIQEMKGDADMHCVRFNKRVNHLDGNDFIMRISPRKHVHPLLATASHSNNPSIIRTDKLRKEWMPLCAHALRHISGDLGGSAFGLEEILFKHHVQDIRQWGFDAVQRKWGTYVFGGVGDSARIVHLGE